MGAVVSERVLTSSSGGPKETFSGMGKKRVLTQKRSRLNITTTLAPEDGLMTCQGYLGGR